MKLNVFLFLFGIFCGMLFYNKVLDIKVDDKNINRIEVEIDTVFSERTNYIKDTVIVKQKVVIDHFFETNKKIDDVFADTSVTNKQKLFDSVYSGNIYDSFRVLDMTSTQAHDAIEAKLLQQRDSSLLDICEDNVKQCDKSLETIKGKIDTLKEFIPKENKTWKIVGIVSSATVGVLLIINFLR